MDSQSKGSTQLLERITIDPDICHGKPCIRGLRYPVATVSGGNDLGTPELWNDQRGNTF
jgi:uncharacterized protein (DUF433 family)